MYAIVKCGGHQVRMSPGTKVTVDRIAGDPGLEVSFDQVLLVEKDDGEVLAGTPYVEGARVLATVDGEVRGPKIRVFKKKRRKGYRKTIGHRDTLTRLAIKEIVL